MKSRSLEFYLPPCILESRQLALFAPVKRLYYAFHMALFVPVIIGVPIGYFTWAKVFNLVDDSISQTLKQNGKMVHF